VGFKLILNPLEAKIHPSEISQKMKKFVFMSNSELIKSKMGNGTMIILIHTSKLSKKLFDVNIFQLLVTLQDIGQERIYYLLKFFNIS
jgi:hypothetical protein